MREYCRLLMHMGVRRKYVGRADGRTAHEQGKMNLSCSINIGIIIQAVVKRKILRWGCKCSTLNI